MDFFENVSVLRFSTIGMIKTVENFIKKNFGEEFSFVIGKDLVDLEVKKNKKRLNELEIKDFLKKIKKTLSVSIEFEDEYVDDGLTIIDFEMEKMFDSIIPLLFGDKVVYTGYLHDEEGEELHYLLVYNGETPNDILSVVTQVKLKV